MNRRGVRRSARRRMTWMIWVRMVRVTWGWGAVREIEIVLGFLLLVAMVRGTL
jgi:hypothetical protein